MQTSETIHPEKMEKSIEQTSRRVGRVNHFTEEGNTFLFYGENANIALVFMSDDVLRIKLFFTDVIDLQPTIAVVKRERGSVRVAVEERDHTIILSTIALQVIITKQSFSLKVCNQSGEPLFEEQEILWDHHGLITCSTSMYQDSHFYGLGEKTGFLDKKGERYTMWNSDVYAPHVPEIEALYVSIPFFIHFRYEKPAYGIFLDNPGKTIFDMRTHSDRYVYQVETGELDYYVIHAPTIKGIIERYTSLTGRMSIPPKWAIGYHQSRYSYMNQEEVLQLARTFREKQIPCDVIYLDIHYMDKYRVFTWDKSRFPNPKAMMTQLREMGFRIVPIVNPGVKKDPTYSIYREGIEHDYFCRKLEGDLFLGDVWPGASAFPDFTQDEVADWWGEKHKFYTEQGISGIWNDMNEPAVFNESKTMDLDVVHQNNGNLKTHQELHNLYGMSMSKATYEGLKKQLNGERPFVLTRAGYAGVQRYAAVWTGDNRSFWEHMAMAVPMTLNLGLSGVPFAGPDIGGFAHHATGELLARWTQMGVFFPYCRNHSAIDTVRQEPWSFGEEVEEICRKYISLRYQLLPHLYSLFYEASQTGMPIIRPLILEYPNDHAVYNLCDQFLLGSTLMVAPIFRPDTEYRTVYLPEGIWYDYWTGQRYIGRQQILAHAPLDTLPLFVKAGAILPEETLKQYVDQPCDHSLTIFIYTGVEGKSSYQLYEDDGTTFKYEEGAYNLLQFDLEEKQGEMIFSYSYVKKHDESKWEELLFKFKHMPFVPNQVQGLSQVKAEQLKDVVAGWTYDLDQKELTIKASSTSEKGMFCIF